VSCNIVCAGLCQRRGYHCPMKPRCRWRIGADSGLALVPYRLQVVLTENRRAEGKVRQEVLADLGTIDGILLPAFWSGVGHGVLGAIQGPGWEERSIWARMAFWEQAKPKLTRLANRLGPDLKRIRMAVHARVPWPMDAERAKLPLMEAEAELASAMSGYELSAKTIEANETLIEHATKQNRELRALAMFEAKTLAEVGARVRSLKGEPARPV
jgi:hypothetical protein